MGAQQMPGGGSTSDPYADANLAQRTSGVQDHTLRQESRPALRPGAKHSEPPPAPASQHVLRDPMASLEGRWAEGLQGRIDARTAREREAQRSKLGAPQRTGAGDRHSQDPIVAAAANGAILPFSEHPAVTDPMRSVWKHKKFALDPTKTSAGLTQDLIKWSKFDNRYQKPRSPRSPRSRSPGARPKDSAQPESPGSKEAARREDEEVATAMHKVQEDLDSERKSDTARFHAMVRHGWTMPHRHYEDALHLDLRRGLSNAKKRLDEVILERDQFQASSNIMQHRWKALKERCESLEELLKLKQAEMMELDRETAKLRFLIGMREGEVAQLQRQLDHVNGLKGSLEDRLLFEQAPGGPPRPATPVMNEIDGSARSLIKDLTELEQDLHERIAMTEKMGSMVETVAVETKKRVLHEASLRPGVVEAETQTACELADMDLVCTLDEEVSVNEVLFPPAACKYARGPSARELSCTHARDNKRMQRHANTDIRIHTHLYVRVHICVLVFAQDPWLIMEKLRSAHRGKQRFQVGVPETFKDVVLDSRHWHRDRQERQEALLQNPTEMMCKLVSLFFSKMEKNEHDLVHLGSWPRNAAGGPMTHHIHECNLKAAGLKSGADLETMDLVAFLEHENFRANELVKVFARVCGMPVSSNEMELPQETQNYLLDVVFVLHEISHEHQKRAKMTAKQRSEMKALTDEQIFNKKFEPIGDDENALIQGLRTGESVSFKKAQVCKVIKQTMAHKACYTFNEGETLNFQEANKLMPLGDALEYAVQVYEEVRVKRLAFFKDAFRQISPSGKVYVVCVHAHACVRVRVSFCVWTLKCEI